jgi:hypothetical protein
MNATKAERFAEFLRRLSEAPSASNADEAFAQVSDILNAVEDEMTTIPFNPANWMNDGRMYPPQEDNRRADPDRPDVRKYISKRHRLFFGDNGAIEIQTDNKVTVFEKAGSDNGTIQEVHKS